MGLLRESSTDYDTYYLDVITEAGKSPESYKILREGDKVSTRCHGIMFSEEYSNLPDIKYVIR